MPFLLSLSFFYAGTHQVQVYISEKISATWLSNYSVHQNFIYRNLHQQASDIFKFLYSPFNSLFKTDHCNIGSLKFTYLSIFCYCQYTVQCTLYIQQQTIFKFVLQMFHINISKLNIYVNQFLKFLFIRCANMLKGTVSQEKLLNGGLGEMDWTLTIDCTWFIHFPDQLFKCHNI